MNSPVLSVTEMRASEEAAFARGISASALMEQAGAGVAEFIGRQFPDPGRCVIFAGKGNNGGDAVVAGRHLREAGWSVQLHLIFPKAESSALLQENLARLPSATESPSQRARPLVVLDGLLGLGAKPPLREPVRAACREINRLRAEGAWIAALDLPSGLDGDTGTSDPDTVRADTTFAIGYAKRGLLADAALDFVGRLEVIPLPDLSAPASAPAAVVATPGSLRGLLPRRPFGSYKNQYGRVGIVAGSRGLSGAALLCAEGALRGGAGLVNLFVPEPIYAIVATAAPMEAMVRPIDSLRDLLETDVEIAAWALGPGLGASERDDIRALIEQLRPPMVIDADGLNALAGATELLQRCAGPRLLTPHPGEMKRLCGHEPGDRLEEARAFVAKHPVTLLLKGSRTIVAEQGQPPSFNTTGHPGMASGGMGDVLTGVCAALLAQSLSPCDAARVGAWVCGRAAELAIFHGGQSAESLLARDVIANLGAAFNELQRPPALPSVF